MPFFLLEKAIRANGKEKIIIAGPEGLKHKTKQIIDFANYTMEFIESKLEIEYIEVNHYEIYNIMGHIKLKAVEVEHGNTKPSYGYILSENEKNIGFTGDSGFCEEIEYLITNSNILIADTSTKIGDSYHMGVDNIEYLLKKYPEKRIITTHMRDGIKECLEKLEYSNLMIPEDGTIIKI